MAGQPGVYMSQGEGKQKRVSIWERFKDDARFWLTVLGFIVSIVLPAASWLQNGLQTLRRDQAAGFAAMRQDMQENYVRKDTLAELRGDVRAARDEIKVLQDDVRWLVRQQGGR